MSFLIGVAQRSKGGKFRLNSPCGPSPSGFLPLARLRQYYPDTADKAGSGSPPLPLPRAASKPLSYLTGMCSRCHLSSSCCSPLCSPGDCSSPATQFAPPAACSGRQMKTPLPPLSPACSRPVHTRTVGARPRKLRTGSIGPAPPSDPASSFQGPQLLPRPTFQTPRAPAPPISKLSPY